MNIFNVIPKSLIGAVVFASFLSSSNVVAMEQKVEVKVHQKQDANKKGVFGTCKSLLGGGVNMVTKTIKYAMWLNFAWLIINHVVAPNHDVISDGLVGCFEPFTNNTDFFEWMSTTLSGVEFFSNRTSTLSANLVAPSLVTFIQTYAEKIPVSSTSIQEFAIKIVELWARVHGGRV